MFSPRDSVKAKADIITPFGLLIPKGTTGTVISVSESGDTCKVQFYKQDGTVMNLVEISPTDVVLLYDIQKQSAQALFSKKRNRRKSFPAPQFFVSQVDGDPQRLPACFA